jgi:hypothetical protein
MTGCRKLVFQLATTGQCTIDTDLPGAGWCRISPDKRPFRLRSPPRSVSVNPPDHAIPRYLPHSKRNINFPKFAGYFRHFATLVLSWVFLLLKKQMGGSPRLAGITASVAAHPFSRAISPKPAQKSGKGASKSLIPGILHINSFVLNGLESVFGGLSH